MQPNNVFMHTSVSTYNIGCQVLLVLDDCCERDHEKAVNLIDTENGSKVLLSSRVRPVLEDKGGSLSTSVIDLQLPK